MTSQSSSSRLPCAAVTLLLATVAAGCGGHRHGPGTIVFQSDRSGREALYAVRPDGSGLTKLLDLPQVNPGVLWTRDGTKALVTDEATDYMYEEANAYVFEPASRTRRHIRLPGLEQVSDMPWSPDGKRLVLASKDDIVVLDVQTGMRRRLRDVNADDFLKWSPDGKHLLFLSGRDVYAVSANGGVPTRLMRLPRGHEPAGLQWSSDEKWISFTEIGAVKTRLYVVRSNGTGLHLIARDTERAAWSPTGERLAFPSHTGIVLVDVENGRRRQLTERPIEVPFDQGPAWSPDGERILFARNDLTHDAAPEYPGQLWTMKADGTEQHPVTHAFPGDGANGPADWVAGTVTGTPIATLPLVSLRGARTVATRLPIVALAAEGNRAAVNQGLGGIPGLRSPLGPIVVWNPVGRSRMQIPVRGCRNAYDVMFAAGGVGYRCDNPSESYGGDDSLRLARPGRRSWTEVVHTSASEFSGSQLGGLVADGSAIAYDEGLISSSSAPCEGCITRSRIWRATSARKAIVRTFPGQATVTSLDRGRIAVVRNGKTVSVLFPGGGIRTFALGRPQIFGAALDGSRLVVLQSRQLTVLDLRSGRRAASWPVRRGFGPDPVLDDARGDLAAYVVGVAIHVLRLSDGREIVIDTPNATGPAFARLVPSGVFYSYNEAYDKRPGRLVFVTRSELLRALDSKAAAR